ncbi:hypothetical protein GDO78_003855 [Eleutherodactylus coqui]|uniref:Uncharacterized protein n=1 Tax=Eleutherodactylus coqui TaxID=57060 RepID=A0A8J6K1A3_ELECQ|nr:hypothetical protein GDO78_003855 [Eleutherodactylus coqui]
MQVVSTASFSITLYRQLVFLTADILNLACPILLGDWELLTPLSQWGFLRKLGNSWPTVVLCVWLALERRAKLNLATSCHPKPCLAREENDL